MPGASIENLPRLLVFSFAVPESRFAGSLLLLRLLKDYPPERLLVVGPRPHPESEVLSCRYEALHNVPLARLDRTRFARLNRSLAAFGLGAEVSARAIEEIARRFRPDAVFTVMEESHFYRAASRFCSRNKVPLVLWVHDRVELFEPLYSWASERRRRRDAGVYRSAAVRFCISPILADRLYNDYGAKGSVLYPNRSDDLVPRPITASESLRGGSRLVVGYAGGLSYGYDEGLQSILPALRAAGGVLRVYSHAAPAFQGDGIEYAGFATSPLLTWERVKTECDVVLQPYAWRVQFRELYEAHFPSKLTEYLALGMPVVISGPTYAAGVAWGLRHPSAAITISDPATESMTSVWTRLRDEPSLRARLSSEGIRAGREQFDPVTIRARFLQELRNVVAASAKEDETSRC